jgi:ATP adenylyltransferase
MLDRLWAGWRSSFVQGKAQADNLQADIEGTLFERVLAVTDDEAAGIIHRGPLVSAVLNAFPYGSGHMLVVPNRGVGKLSDLAVDEARELWDTVQKAVAVAEAVYQPPGINVGLNQGKAGGASVPDHLHVHVLPRWDGDTTFMTSIAETRVLPEPLDESARKLRAAWSS